MSALPYVFTVTPEAPIRCGRCEEIKTKGEMIETTIRPADIVTMKCAVLICASCVWTFDTALTVHSMERDGHAPPPEDSDAKRV
jgi:hypothetical protein